jgi:transposase
VNEELADVDTLRARHIETVAMLDALKKAYDKLLFEHELLKRQVFGQKAERVRHEEAQLPLLEFLAAIGRIQAGDVGALDEAQRAADEAAKAIAAAKASRSASTNKEPSPRGRRKLALEDLPLRRVVLVPPERLAPGGERLVKIGEEKTQLVERIPASMVRIEVVREKYKVPEPARADATPSQSPTSLPPPLGAATRIFIADMPERTIPKSMVEPGFLAHVLVSKFCDNIPLHRQEGIFKREGFRVACSTLGEWVDASTNLLGHVFDAMWKDAKENASYSIVDATGVLVLAKGECKRAHFYVVVVPREHVLFRFTRKNDGLTVAALLSDFKGYLHADAATVYHELYRQQLEQLTEVGCWAHTRRKFFEALSRDRERALVAIGYFSHLYDAHRATLDKDGVADTTKRAELARPILARLLCWARREFRAVEEGTPIHLALGYLMRQRRALLRFLDDGRIRLDTNPAELALRREVVGRKNWLFVGSDDGARWNTIAVSLIASCQLHGIEPWAYLRDVLTLLPSWPQLRALELSPKYWRQTAARPEVQERLAELRLVDRAVPVRPTDALATADA